jgi:hypothetical protein
MQQGEGKTTTNMVYMYFILQASDSEEDEISDDEFIPVPSTQHPGHKMASVRWFQETQATQIYDPSQENFIAEWFHGVISRRYFICFSISIYYS